MSQLTYTGYNNYGLNYNYPSVEGNFYQTDYRLGNPSYFAHATTGYSDYGLNYSYPNNQANFYQRGYRPVEHGHINMDQVRAIVVGDEVRVNQGVRNWATGEGMPSWVHGRVYPVIEIRTREGATQLLLGAGINSWIWATDVTSVSEPAPPPPPPPPRIRVGDEVRVNRGVSNWATGEGMPSWVHGRVYPVIEIRTRGGATQLLLGAGINSWIWATDVKKLTEPAPPPAPATIRVGDRVRVNQGVRTWATGEGMPSWVNGRTYTVIEIRTRGGATQLLLGDINSWILQTDVTRV